MTKIEIYTKPTCPFCIKAKELLKSKNVDYTEYNIAGNDELRSKMIKRANGRTTVPQIFIDDQHIGGCDDIHSLDEKGELENLIKNNH